MMEHVIRNIKVKLKNLDVPGAGDGTVGSEIIGRYKKLGSVWPAAP